MAAKTPGEFPKRVLVVEDDAILALALEDELRDHGVSDVVLCHSTDAALKELRRKKPDAIILDVHLADRDDGWAIAELVDSIGPRPPQIIFSTGAPQDIPADIAKLGAVLAKPYRTEELIGLLGSARKPGLLQRLRK